jgi:hypothetical protein
MAASTVVFAALLITLACVVCSVCVRREGFTSRLNKRSSCYSCEHAFPPGQEWRGQPSKCFSCERQMVATGGNPFLASRTVTG